MTFRQYTIATGTSTALAATGWLLMLFFVDPTDFGAAGAAGFLFALWLTLVGLVMLAGIVTPRIRRAALHQLTANAAAAGLRAALVSATLVILFLILHRSGYLTLLRGTLLIACAVAFLARYRRTRRPRLPPASNL